MNNKHNIGVMTYLNKSFDQDERVKASEVLEGPVDTKFSGDKTAFVEDIRSDFYNK